MVHGLPSSIQIHLFVVVLRRPSGCGSEADATKDSVVAPSVILILSCGSRKPTVYFSEMGFALRVTPVLSRFKCIFLWISD
jgi:hypothetical protein